MTISTIIIIALIIAIILMYLVFTIVLKTNEKSYNYLLERNNELEQRLNVLNEEESRRKELYHELTENKKQADENKKLLGEGSDNDRINTVINILRNNKN